MLGELETTEPAALSVALWLSSYGPLHLSTYLARSTAINLLNYLSEPAQEVIIMITFLLVEL